MLGDHCLCALATEIYADMGLFHSARKSAFYDAVAGFWSQASSSLEQGIIFLSQSHLCLSCALSCSFLAPGNFKLGQLLERHALTQLWEKPIACVIQEANKMITAIPSALGAWE